MANLIIVSNYYYPETGAAANRITNLAESLRERGNIVQVICPLPNYPHGSILNGYKGKLKINETINNVDISRYWIYPTVSKNPFKRFLSMFSFAFSLWSFFFKKEEIKSADWIIVQNSPLLVSFSTIILFRKIYHKKIALNVSDLWPLSALELGAIKRGILYYLLEKVELFNYKNSDIIIGQSNEIIDHINQILPKRTFLYRNLQRDLYFGNEYILKNPKRIKIFYAGLLGVAQGIYNIIKEINFNELNVDFDIFGQGNEQQQIVTFLEKYPNRGVAYKGSISKKQLNEIIPSYQASIVPLVKSIKGAVPSKIFELMQFQIPIIFCGGGEGAKIINQYKIGFNVLPGDLNNLKKVITDISNMTQSDLMKLKENCRIAISTDFSFELQLTKLIDILS